MGGSKIKEMGSSSRGRYRRTTADIIPDWSDICSTADIPELSAIVFKFYLEKGGVLN